MLSSTVDEHYFDTLAIPLLQGRNFHVDDDLDAPRVAIVNQQLAQHYWPNQDPLGKRFRLNDQDKTWVQIVGVAKTSKYLFIAEPPSDFVYLPYRQRKPQRMIMVTQSAGDPSALVGPAARGRPQSRRESADLQRADDGRVLPDAGGQHLQRAHHHGRIDGTRWASASRSSACTAWWRTPRPGAREKSASAWRSGRTGRPCCGWCCARGSCWPSWDSCWAWWRAWARESCWRRHFRAATIEGTSLALLLVTPIVLAVTFLAAYIPARRASRINPMQALRYD